MWPKLRPEIDEFVLSLPQINSYTNRFMRQDGNEGLETMTMYIPRSHAVRALADNSYPPKCFAATVKLPIICNHGRC
jgi:hypothetical protein